MSEEHDTLPIELESTVADSGPTVITPGGQVFEELEETEDNGDADGVAINLDERDVMALDDDVLERLYKRGTAIVYIPGHIDGPKEGETKYDWITRLVKELPSGVEIGFVERNHVSRKEATCRFFRRIPPIIKKRNAEPTWELRTTLNGERASYANLHPHWYALPLREVDKTFVLGPYQVIPGRPGIDPFFVVDSTERRVAGFNCEAMAVMAAEAFNKRHIETHP